MTIFYSSDNSKTLDEFKAAAAKVSSTTEPTFSPQGGIVGPVKEAGSSSTTSGATTSGATTSGAATTTTSQPGSASELKGSVLLASILVTVFAAWGVAELMG